MFFFRRSARRKRSPEQNLRAALERLAQEQREHLAVIRRRDELIREAVPKYGVRPVARILGMSAAQVSRIARGIDQRKRP